MSPTNNGWPNEPGVPLNPEMDGWHWLRRKSGGVDPWFWEAEQGGPGLGGWSEEGGEGAPADFERAFTYWAPCITPDQHAAALAAARRETVEACATFVQRRADACDAHGQGEWLKMDAAAQEIRALAIPLPLPATDALAAQIAAAEARGRELVVSALVKKSNESLPAGCQGQNYYEGYADGLYDAMLTAKACISPPSRDGGE